jgi:cytochrome c-type biogenesis protein CcmF
MLSLELGKPVDALGYTLTYKGDRPFDGDKWAFDVEIQGTGERRIISPTMYYSDFTKGIMRHPDVLNLINKDFYVAPLSLEEPSAVEVSTIELHQNSPANHVGLALTFTEFDFSEDARDAMFDGGPFEMRVTVLVAESGSAGRTRITLRMVNSGSGDVEFPREQYVSENGSAYGLSLQKIVPPDESGEGILKVIVTVEVPRMAGAEKGETLVIEASIKPMINLVWAGTVTLVLGFLLTIVRRVEEARSRERSN